MIRRGAESSPAQPDDRSAREPVGDLDGPLVEVDRSGSVAPMGAGWQIGWAVGAEDRWHVAARETAVRSRLLEDTPVTETAMRVPGGDIVQRVAAVRDANGRAVVLEFDNQTPGPVSLAVALVPRADAAGRAAGGSGRSRPAGAVGVGRAAVSGSRLMADGRIALELNRSPGGSTATADGDVWPAVESEPASADCEARSRTGRAAAAAVVPLATRVALRFVIPVDGGPVQARAPQQVSTGWLAVVARAATVGLPDDSAARAWRRGVAAAILAAGGADVAAAARAAVVLDRVGLTEEADRGRDVVLAAVDRAGLAAAGAVPAMRALASRRLRAGRESGLAEVAGPLAAAAGDDLDPFTLEQTAAALGAEAPGAARDARRMLAEMGGGALGGGALTPADDLAAVRGCIAFGGDGLSGVESLLGCLLAEAPDHVVVAPSLPGAWIGSSIDARTLVTRHGRLSFSLRWHGPRPAVLWDREPTAGAAAADRATVRCGLDASWSSAALAGEALLNAGT